MVLIISLDSIYRRKHFRRFGCTFNTIWTIDICKTVTYLSLTLEKLVVNLHITNLRTKPSFTCLSLTWEKPDVYLSITNLTVILLFFLLVAFYCWLFVAISSQIQVQVLIEGFGSSIQIFVIFMPICSWLWLDRIMMFGFVLSLKSLIAAISQSSVYIPIFGCSQQRLSNSTPGAQGMALYAGEGFRSFRQSKLDCSCQESCVFRICSRINNFHVYASYHSFER